MDAALTSVQQELLPGRIAAGRGPRLPVSAANPPPRRVGRDPASYISDAAWSAMASGEAFATSAPETAAPASSPRHDTESIASGSTTVPNLNEPYRRRPAEPPVYGPFFSTHGVSGRGACARQTKSISSSSCRRRSCSTRTSAWDTMRQEASSTPTLARRADWNKADAYQWALFAATTEAYVHAEHVINTIPSHQNLHGSQASIHLTCSGTLPDGTMRSTTTAKVAVSAGIDGLTFFISWPLVPEHASPPNGTIGMVL